MKDKIIVLAALFVIGQLVIPTYAVSDSPFERQFADVKFLDAYFGTENEKIEVEPGDKNVPFTVIMSSVGTEDLTGIKGLLALPIGFTSSDNPQKNAIEADFAEVAKAGNSFALTFYVNLDPNLSIQEYPGNVKVTFSRLRESGVRESFNEFHFKVTGKSILNMKAEIPFLQSLKNNQVMVEVSNQGTAPLSNIEIILENTQTSIATTREPITNLENVVFDQNHWNTGTVEPKSKKYFSFNVYIPQNLADETLHTPMLIKYSDAHGNKVTQTRTIDFYIKGFIDASITGVNVIELSGKQTIVGDVLNKGNAIGLFGTVTVEPLGDSNIKKSSQYLDEIDTDSPIPFNIPIEFVGEPRVGEHKVLITLTYKDSLRQDNVVTQEATIFYKNLTPEKTFDYTQPLIIVVIASTIVGFLYKTGKLKGRANAPQASS